jgi:hypothetical protein
MADFDITISDGTSVEVVVTPSSGTGGGVTDHGALTGLLNDDHTQYHTDARGDGRYKPLSYVPAWTDITGKPSVFPPDTHNHDALYAPISHNHAAGDVNSGTFAIARLPVADSGESNATEVVRADDARLSDARTPTSHYHAAADVTSGVFNIARLATGTPDGTKFVRDDGVLAVPGEVGGATEQIIHVFEMRPTSDANIVWTNMPAAATEFLGSTANLVGYTFADLREASEIRFASRFRTAGSTGAKLYIEYQTSTPGTWARIDAGGTTDFALDGATGLVTSSWATIPGAAQNANQTLRIMGSGGNAAADPAWGFLLIQIKATL